MTYICIKCRKTWMRGEGSHEPSGGLCIDCATDYIRMRQRKNGFHDCFRRATAICATMNCTYWSCCNKDLMVGKRIGEPEYKVVAGLVA